MTPMVRIPSGAFAGMHFSGNVTVREAQALAAALTGSGPQYTAARVPPGSAQSPVARRAEPE